MGTFSGAYDEVLAHSVHLNVRYGGIMDADLEGLSRKQLIAEVKRLRQGIREHRDSTGHELCWHHPALWSLLPEKSDPLPVVPEWPQFLRGCLRYRESLDEQLPQAPRSHEPYEG
jgi:hypothetical protein